MREINKNYFNKYTSWMMAKIQKPGDKTESVNYIFFNFYY